MPTIDLDLIDLQIAELEAELLFCDTETEAKSVIDLVEYLKQKRRLAELGID